MLLSQPIGNRMKGNLSYEEMFKVIKDAGFDAIDFSFCGGDERTYNGEFKPEQFVEWRKYVESMGICFNQAHAPFPSSKPDEKTTKEIFETIVTSMKNAALLGVKIIVVHPKQHLTYSEEGNPEKLFEENIKFYNSLKPYCEEYGIQVALENMWQAKHYVGGYRVLHSTCSSPAEFNRYLDALDRRWFVGCLDIGHSLLVHVEPQDFIKEMGSDRLKALHVHDVLAGNDTHTLPYYGGSGDWDKITKALKEIGYTGDLTYEANNFNEHLPAELALPAAKYMAEVGRYLISQIEK
ncbi:MAG: sugar phosphate isomerase/epimerase [Clostridia bacterium]|nr:sugar phosphate isomerase/epimerase [Clostridia bacterium]